MSIVPGFQYDLFVSYAHLDDVPWTLGADGWVTAFVKTLETQLQGVHRTFKVWFDPQLRTAEDFNLAISNAIAESAVFLSVLSPAYDDSPYCKKEVAAFREQQHPAFGLTVGSLKRMQGMVIRPLAEEQWPPELRTTSPYRFYNSAGDRFSRPKEEDDHAPYLQGLGRVRDSIQAVLEKMRIEKERGIAIPHSYEMRSEEGGERATVYLAEAPDDLYYKREQLRSALAQAKEFEVSKLTDARVTTGLRALSVHLFGKYPGRPVEGREISLPRLQLQEVLEAGAVRRPLVWLARDVKPEEAETEEHQRFLKGLLEDSRVELLRMGFEDLKDEVRKRMSARPGASPRRTRDEPIIHIWHQIDNPAPLAPLRTFLKSKNCGISVYYYNGVPREKLQSKLAFCDGLIISYTPETKGWAEDVMMEAFQLRRREERPLAYAAVQLPPPGIGNFNFEHPRVVPIQEQGDQFQGMDAFLERLEESGG